MWEPGLELSVLTHLCPQRSPVYPLEIFARHSGTQECPGRWDDSCLRSFRSIVDVSQMLLEDVRIEPMTRDDGRIKVKSRKVHQMRPQDLANAHNNQTQ